ncbi:SGNH/GDSL hydrolase family protein [Limnohabitans sp. T6-5]|uniref:SGNH/GDSL hydrolase family protein n=1 Tax=Limnohabitans sp. T6-5 TaxID=1100724 RepID=UPI0011B2A03D|nr:SGNH/GDSL hydrolase family protein [Limnohabitans sp. T6-5]
MAEKGITTQDWVRRFGVSVERDAHTLDVVLISLGSNDGQNANATNLFKARSLLAQAKTVIWIAPGPKYPARSQILGVAREFGDVVYERPVEQMQDDGVHFDQMGYKRMASVLARY